MKLETVMVLRSCASYDVKIRPLSYILLNIFIVSAYIFMKSRGDFFNQVSKVCLQGNFNLYTYSLVRKNISQLNSRLLY